MRIKDTLNMGKTAFPMRGSLPTREVEWQKHGKKTIFMNNVKN